MSACEDVCAICSPTSSISADEVELCGERLADAVDRSRAQPRADRSPSGVARLVEQPGVLERDAQARREGREQRTSESLNAYSRSRFWSEMRPAHLVADHERREDRGPGGSPRSMDGSGRASTDHAAQSWLTTIGSADCDHRWRPESHDRPTALVREAHAALDRVRSSHGPGSWSKTAMSTTWASKISWILLADELVHRLHVELRGEALAGRC